MQTVSDTAVHMNIDPAAASVKMGIAGTGAVASYMTLNEWVALFTLLYVILQIGLLIPKYRKLYQAWCEGREIRVDIE